MYQEGTSWKFWLGAWVVFALLCWWAFAVAGWWKAIPIVIAIIELIIMGLAKLLEDEPEYDHGW